MNDDEIEIRIYDNGGDTFDRYTVFFTIHEIGEEYALGIGDTGNVPNGFCMHVEADEGPFLGERIRLDQMTRPAQYAVANELAIIEQELRRIRD